MKKITLLKSTLLAVGLLIGMVNLSATPLFTEDFTEYTIGSNLAGQGGWTAAGSGTTVNPTIADVTPLTYDTYNGGGGNYVTFIKGSSTTNRVYKSFTSTTLVDGDVYYISFLLNIASTTEAGTSNDSYFTAITNTGNTTYYDRLIVKQSGTGYVMGISKNAAASYVYGTTECTFNQTYLVVIRHTVVAGGGNDVVDLWINPAISLEPADATIEASTSTGNDPSTISDFVWQNSSTRGPAGSIDGIRIGYGTTSALAWANLEAKSEATNIKTATGSSVISISSNKGFLTINLPDAKPIQIINMQGTIQTINGKIGDNIISLPQGAYVIKVNEFITKSIVR